jgi:hypothetical protein
MAWLDKLSYVVGSGIIVYVFVAQYTMWQYPTKQYTETLTLNMLPKFVAKNNNGCHTTTQGGQERQFDSQNPEQTKRHGLNQIELELLS